MCVSAYRYIKSLESDGRDGFSEELRERMYAELDAAYRGYFYGEKERPGFYIHPAASSVDMKIKQYSFMKVSNPDYVAPLYSDDGLLLEGQVLMNKTKPYPLRNFNSDEERKPQQIDMFDIGGCGCFVNFD